MNCLDISISMQEVPDEISISFLITGCPNRCNGCHTKKCWDANAGEPLTDSRFVSTLKKYKGLFSCVLFYGGEWVKEELISKLKIAREYGVHTCLYTGLETIDSEILSLLTYLKTGPWNSDLGGLDSETTNQVFKDLRTGEVLNHKFRE